MFCLYHILQRHNIYLLQPIQIIAKVFIKFSRHLIFFVRLVEMDKQHSLRPVMSRKFLAISYLAILSVCAMLNAGGQFGQEQHLNLQSNPFLNSQGFLGPLSRCHHHDSRSSSTQSEFAQLSVGNSSTKVSCTTTPQITGQKNEDAAVDDGGYSLPSNDGNSPQMPDLPPPALQDTLPYMQERAKQLQRDLFDITMQLLPRVLNFSRYCQQVACNRTLLDRYFSDNFGRTTMQGAANFFRNAFADCNITTYTIFTDSDDNQALLAKLWDCDQQLSTLKQSLGYMFPRLLSINIAEIRNLLITNSD